MQYRFAYVIDPRSRHRIGPGELYIEPGLVYVAAEVLSFAASRSALVGAWINLFVRRRDISSRMRAGDELWR